MVPCTGAVLMSANRTARCIGFTKDDFRPFIVGFKPLNIIVALCETLAPRGFEFCKVLFGTIGVYKIPVFNNKSGDKVFCR